MGLSGSEVIVPPFKMFVKPGLAHPGLFFSFGFAVGDNRYVTERITDRGI
jgi:hypothetical protein